MFTLAKFQVSEKPVCLGFLSVPYDTEVLPYPDMVVYASGIQESEPFTSDKLPVSHQMSNTAFACQREEPCNEFHALSSVGVPPLVHHLEGYWECHAIVDDAKSEYIDVGIAELPVGPVHGQGVRPLYRYKLQNESGYEVSTDDALCNQPLDSAQ